MHPETEFNVESEPIVKPSKLKRIKANVVVATWIALPVAVTGGLMFASVKMTKMQLDTARMNLEAAKLKHLKP
jgi:hypothetical protein